MLHKHYKVTLQKGEILQITLDKQADVLLMDEDNYNKFAVGKKYRSYGGRATRSPVQMAPPEPGRWRLVVIPAGSGEIRVTVETISKQPADGKRKIRPW
jgi:hypothetical protein